MTTVNKNFGFVSDNDESLKAKEGGKFGLNTGFLTHFAYNPNGGSEGAASDCIDITFTIGDREFKNRLYDPVGDLRKGNEVLSPNDDGYMDHVNELLKQISAVVTHTLKSVGVTEDTISNALRTPPTSFADWAKIMTSLPAAGFQQREVDIFLEWQWSIKEGRDRTYLTLPKNMKGGYFLCPHQAPTGKWEEIIDEEGLRYVDSANNEHPFKKSKNFMQSNKGRQQVEGQDDPNSVPNMGDATPNTNASGEPQW